MKKKLFVGIAAATLAAAMCVSFAACGAGGGGKAKGIKGYEVTEEQWNAAIEALQKDDAVFTIDYYTEVSVNASGGGQKGSTKTTSTYTVIKNDGKEYVKSVDTVEYGGAMVTEQTPKKTEEIDIMYAEREGTGTLYTVYDDTEDGGWDKSENENSIIPLSIIFDWVESYTYSDYKYSAEDKGYILSTTGEDEDPFVIKFDKDGRLSAVYYGHEEKVETPVSKATTTATYSVVITYTAKEITIPTVE